MKIAEGIDVSCKVLDIETLAGLFYVGIYDGEKEEYLDFEVSKRKNELFKFINWYLSNSFN